MNARIDSIQSQTGVRGDGEKVFSINTIAVPIPAMIKEPSSYRRSTDRSQGIETTALIMVNREALRRQGYTLAVGDRVGYLQIHLGAKPMSGDIVALRSLEADTTIEMALNARVDNAEVV